MSNSLIPRQNFQKLQNPAYGCLKSNQCADSGQNLKLALLCLGEFTMYLTNICTQSAKIGENVIPWGAGQTGWRMPWVWHRSEQNGEGQRGAALGGFLHRRKGDAPST